MKVDLSNIEVDMIFKNYKHLLVTVGLQKKDEHISGHQRKQLLEILSESIRFEKLKDNCDMIIIREIKKTKI